MKSFHEIGVIIVSHKQMREQQYRAVWWVIQHNKKCVCVCEQKLCFEDSSCIFTMNTHTSLLVPKQLSSFFPADWTDRRTHTHTADGLVGDQSPAAHEIRLMIQQTQDDVSASKGKKSKWDSSCRCFHQWVIRPPELEVSGELILYACCYCPPGTHQKSAFVRFRRFHHGPQQRNQDVR